MKVRTLALLITVMGFQANSAIYTCKATMDIKTSFVHTVDTLTNRQYIWLFRSYPNAQPWCGTAFDSTKLTCQIRASEAGVLKIYATAEVEIGDQVLSVTTPDCGYKVPCSIECKLSEQ